jgi:hypothetical protein
MSEIKQAPEINPVSKILAEQNRGLVIDRDKDYSYSARSKGNTSLSRTHGESSMLHTGRKGTSQAPTFNIDLQDTTTNEEKMEVSGITRSSGICHLDEVKAD